MFIIKARQIRKWPNVPWPSRRSLPGTLAPSCSSHSDLKMETFHAVRQIFDPKHQIRQFLCRRQRLTFVIKDFHFWMCTWNIVAELKILTSGVKNWTLDIKYLITRWTHLWRQILTLDVKFDFLDPAWPISSCMPFKWSLRPFFGSF